ncbi:MAG TPA: hypothetical protein VIC71_03865 [Gammaproteobacteria bacterium]|jgi:hypothetical protein
MLGIVVARSPVGALSPHAVSVSVAITVVIIVQALQVMVGLLEVSLTSIARGRRSNK